MIHKKGYFSSNKKKSVGSRALVTISPELENLIGALAILPSVFKLIYFLFESNWC